MILQQKLGKIDENSAYCLYIQRFSVSLQTEKQVKNK